MSKINKESEERRKKSIAILISSLALHAIVLFFTIDQHQTKNNNFKKRKKEVIRISLKKKKPITKKSKTMQIVETQERLKKVAPKESRFLSKSNQSFEREVVAKSVGSHKRAGKGTKKGREKKKQSKDVKQKAVTARVVKKVRKKTKKGKKLTLADLAVKQFEKFDKKPTPQQYAAKGLKNGAKGQSGLAQNNDFVEDIPLGDMTNLNTVEFKYFGFYNRIKKQLEQHWGRSIKEKVSNLQRSGRSIASKGNHITSLIITLDGRGSIKEIAVKGTSGINALDEAAVESFNKAGPFPNPPKGMIKNGVATIEWGFVVKS